MTRGRMVLISSVSRISAKRNREEIKGLVKEMSELYMNYYINNI